MSYQFGDVIDRAPTRDYLLFGVPFQDMQLTTDNGDQTRSLEQATLGLNAFRFTPINYNRIDEWKEALQGRYLVMNNSPEGNSPLFCRIERIVCPWGAYAGLKYSAEISLYKESWALYQEQNENKVFPGLTWARETIENAVVEADAITIPDDVPTAVRSQWQELSSPLSVNYTLERIPDENDVSEVVRCTATLGGEFDYTYGPVEQVIEIECNIWTQHILNFAFSWTVANFQGNPIGVVKSLELVITSDVQWALPADPGYQA